MTISAEFDVVADVAVAVFFFHDKHGFKLFYLLLRLLLIIYRNDYCLMEVKEVTRDEPRVERITAMKFKPKSNVRNRSLVWIP